MYFCLSSLIIGVPGILRFLGTSQLTRSASVPASLRENVLAPWRSTLARTTRGFYLKHNSRAREKRVTIACRLHELPPYDIMRWVAGFGGSAGWQFVQASP